MQPANTIGVLWNTQTLSATVGLGSSWRMARYTSWDLIDDVRQSASDFDRFDE